MNKFAAIFFAVVLSTCGNLYSQGEQHLRITGTEEAVEILPFWTSFETVQTVSIPSLAVDELVLSIKWSSPGAVNIPLGDYGGFKGFGTGVIYDEIGDHIGDMTFYYIGQLLGPPPAFEYIGEIKAVGTFFAGSLEGLVISETSQMEGTVEFVPPGIPTYPYYFAEIKGFLTVPEYVDFQTLKGIFACE